MLINQKSLIKVTARDYIFIKNLKKGKPIQLLPEILHRVGIHNRISTLFCLHFDISVVQVSPGSKRHGETAYVKVSTTDSGRFKYVNKKSKYKSDGDEKAKIFYVERRKK